MIIQVYSSKEEIEIRNNERHDNRKSKTPDHNQPKKEKLVEPGKTKRGG